MKILTLIDELDDLIHNAKPVPLTDQVRVDKEAIFDILDQMRADVPETLAQARVDGPLVGGIAREALTEAMSAAIKENIPEIARASAAAMSAPSGASPRPPGAPF
jgi:hypothetical protein